MRWLGAYLAALSCAIAALFLLNVDYLNGAAMMWYYVGVPLFFIVTVFVSFPALLFSILFERGNNAPGLLAYIVLGVSYIPIAMLFPLLRMVAASQNLHYTIISCLVGGIVFGALRRKFWRHESRSVELPDPGIDLKR